MTGSHGPGKLFTPNFHELVPKCESMKIIYVLAIGLFGLAKGQNVKFLVVTESAQPQLNSNFSQGLKSVQDSNAGSNLDMDFISFTRKFADDAYTDLCNKLQSDTYTAIIDMAWGGWIKV